MLLGCRPSRCLHWTGSHRSASGSWVSPGWVSGAFGWLFDLMIFLLRHVEDWHVFTPESSTLLSVLLMVLLSLVHFAVWRTWRSVMQPLVMVTLATGVVSHIGLRSVASELLPLKYPQTNSMKQTKKLLHHHPFESIHWLHQTQLRSVHTGIWSPYSPHFCWDSIRKFLADFFPWKNGHRENVTKPHGKKTPQLLQIHQGKNGPCQFSSSGSV